MTYDSHKAHDAKTAPTRVRKDTALSHTHWLPLNIRNTHACSSHFTSLFISLDLMSLCSFPHASLHLIFSLHHACSLSLSLSHLMCLTIDKSRPMSLSQAICPCLAQHTSPHHLHTYGRERDLCVLAVAESANNKRLQARMVNVLVLRALSRV